MDENTTYTTHEVSGFCGVDLTTVINWIEEGKLPAYKTPGGHRRILKEDLILFLKKYKMPISRELDAGKKRILIVDDDQDVADFVKNALLSEDFDKEIATARDGFSAGKTVGTFGPDIVILDLMLPGLDGFEVCRNIRQDPKTSHIKILAITGYDTPENVEKILRSGADAYLAKPFEMEDLLKEVKKLIFP